MIYNSSKQLIPFSQNKNWYYLDEQCRVNDKYILKLKSFSRYHLSTIIPNDWNNVLVKLFKINDVEVFEDFFVSENYYNHDTDETYISIDFDTNINTGIYYIKIYDSINQVGELYSEPFCIKDGYQPKFTIRWSNKCLLVGDVIYPKTVDGLFKFQYIHFDALTIVLSDTIVEEEVVENDLGNDEAISQIVIQKYMFSEALPFYLIETLSTLSLHSEVYIDESQKQTKKLSKIEVVSEPDEFGCLSRFTLKFEIKRITKAGCCVDSVTKKINYSSNDYDNDNYSTT